jgi:hypothetical protein
VDQDQEGGVRSPLGYQRARNFSTLCPSPTTLGLYGDNGMYYLCILPRYIRLGKGALSFFFFRACARGDSYLPQVSVWQRRQHYQDMLVTQLEPDQYCALVYVSGKGMA